MRKIIAGGAVRLGRVLLFFAAAGCFAADREVSVADYRFEPAVVNIVAGDTVHWINKEKRTSHSVFFTAESLESERFFPGESWSRRFDVPGTYPYRCGPHPEMHGEVVVTPALQRSEQVQPSQ